MAEVLTTGEEMIGAALRKKVIASVFAVIEGALLGEVSLSIAFVSDEAMCELNRRFRGKSGSTDVLTFCASGFESLQKPVLGEIVISLVSAQMQASEFGHSLAEEIAALVAHGLCHLLGLDHEKGEAEASMQTQCEMTFLSSANISPQIALCGRLLN